jgi:hypothetical protein
MTRCPLAASVTTAHFVTARAISMKLSWAMMGTVHCGVAFVFFSMCFAYYCGFYFAPDLDPVILSSGCIEEGNPQQVIYFYLINE